SSARRSAWTRHAARRSSRSVDSTLHGRGATIAATEQEGVPTQPRRQAVRHLTLTQAFGGSNPSGAANPGRRGLHADRPPEARLARAFAFLASGPRGVAWSPASPHR